MGFAQLLDLIDTLHTKTAHIHNGWTKPNSDQENYSLWPHGWCPLLQGIARLCCDPRKSVRLTKFSVAPKYYKYFSRNSLTLIYISRFE